MGVIANVSAVIYLYAGCGKGAADLSAIKVFECNRETGEIRSIQEINGPQSTTYFQLSPDGKSLYAPAENVGIGDAGDAWMVRFPVEENGRLGALEALAKLPCEAPCHVALSPDAKTIAFASYLSGTIGVMPACKDGKVVFRRLPDIGVGPNKKRQAKAYAHFALFFPDGEKIGFVDLGCDRIHFFKTAGLEPIPEMTIRADPGDGPRHAVWSKDARFLFVLNELSSSVVSYELKNGLFSRVGKWSMLPEGFDRFEADRQTLSTKAAAIKLSDDGKLLMASNRGFDSIAFYEVDTVSGCLRLKNIAPLKGSFPRDFEMLPGGQFMVVGHKMSNEIQIYRFERKDCSLRAVGSAIGAWRPLCFKFKSCD